MHISEFSFRAFAQGFLLERLDGHFLSKLSLCIGCLSEVQVEVGRVFFQITLPPSFERVHKHCDKQNVSSDVMRILLEESKTVRDGWHLESVPFSNVTIFHATVQS